MRLVYFSGHGNFGDELNAVLWPRLAAEQFATTDRIGFLGIGTIIGMPTPGCDFLHVFSSGVGYDRLAGWSVPRRIWCVRGPLTAHMLGTDMGAAITDGAILAPSIITEETGTTEKTGADPAAVGVMPHWQSLHAPGWQRACDLAGFTLLDPIGEPVSVIRALRRMRLVLTESLHGAIVADSYGIPWVPICTSRNFSVFKWMDWCLSMEVGLATVMVPPPSMDALLRFGRPAPARWGDRVTFSTCDAVDEFDRRTSVVPAMAPPQGLPTRARALLRPALARSGPLLGPLGRLAGYAPARTAAHLTRAAQAPPTLSRAALRAQRCDQMMQRLGELRRAMAQGAVA